MWRLCGLKWAKMILLLILRPLASSIYDPSLSHAMGRLNLSDGSCALARTYLSLIMSMKSSRGMEELGSLIVMPTVVPFGNSTVNLYTLSISPSFVVWSTRLFLSLPLDGLGSILSQPRICYPKGKRPKLSSTQITRGAEKHKRESQRKTSLPQSTFDCRASKRWFLPFRSFPIIQNQTHRKGTACCEHQNI